MYEMEMNSEMDSNKNFATPPYGFSEEDQKRFSGYSLVCLYLGQLISIVGIGGNSLVIGLTLKRISLLKKSHNWFIACFSLSELCWCIVNQFMPNASSTWAIDDQYRVPCYLYGFFYYYFVQGSYYWPTLLAVNRYIGLCKSQVLYTVMQSCVMLRC